MKNKSRQVLLKPDLSYTVTGKIWIECGQEKFFGPGPVDLLQKIEETGSISKAAKEMGMSYKKAWELINQLNAMSGKPFVITKSGGEQGGGSIITEEAKSLIAYYTKLRTRFFSFLEKETRAMMLYFG